MMNIRRSLIADITEAIAAAKQAGELVFEAEASVVVKRSEDTNHGDYSSPIALSLTKIAKKQPMEIVQIIASHIPKTEYIEKVEGVAPGFINITIKDAYLASRLDDLPQEDISAACNIGEGKHVNMEFISANPTGPLTLGNARTAFTADTLGNVLSYAGYNVVREYYINDAGNQIRRLGESVLRRMLQQQGYQVEFAEDLYQGEYISDIAARMCEEYAEEEGRVFTPADLDDEALLAAISEKAMQSCLSAIKKTITEDLRITFDVWASEKSVRDSGEIEKVLDMLREKQLMYKKDGAEFLKTTEFGDEKDRVMVKKDGSYAYIAPDVAYHQGKFDRKFDLLFTYLGADHQGHIPKLKAALKALGNDTEKLHTLVTQWFVLLRDGKKVSFSKRKGNIYSPKEFITEIGYDVARFLMVQHALDGQMTLDMDMAKEKSEANPVYYVQYAYVRLQAIIRKAKVQGIIPPGEIRGEISSAVAISHASERELALALFAFPETIEDIATSFSAHQLPHFAYFLARAINAFYRDVQVLNEEDEALRMSRLQIVLAAQTVLGKVIDLLGISKPDVM